MLLESAGQVDCLGFEVIGETEVEEEEEVLEDSDEVEWGACNARCGEPTPCSIVCV